MQSVKESFYIILVSVVLGLFVNIFHPDKVVLSWHHPIPATMVVEARDGMEVQSHPVVINIDKVKEWMQNENVLLIDARSPELFNDGHIPGAINVSFDMLEEHIQRILNEPRDRCIVTYCDGPPCEKSVVLAEQLYSLGFVMVGVYYDGIEDWIENGNEIYVGDE